MVQVLYDRLMRKAAVPLIIVVIIIVATIVFIETYEKEETGVLESVAGWRQMR